MDVTSPEKALRMRVIRGQLGSMTLKNRSTPQRCSKVGKRPTMRSGAWGTSEGTAYRFTPVFWKPRIFTQYDYASGDKNPMTACMEL